MCTGTACISIARWHVEVVDVTLLLLLLIRKEVDTMTKLWQSIEEEPVTCLCMFGDYDMAQFVNTDLAIYETLLEGYAKIGELPRCSSWRHVHDCRPRGQLVRAVGCHASTVPRPLHSLAVAVTSNGNRKSLYLAVDE